MEKLTSKKLLPILLLAVFSLTINNDLHSMDNKKRRKTEKEDTKEKQIKLLESSLPEHIVSKIKNIGNFDILNLSSSLITDEQLENILELIELLDLSHKITHLNLSENQLATLPESIGNLTRLVHLDLFDNLITTLPKSIGNLTRLVHLNLFSNLITTLPESVGNLTSLQVLNLSLNQLTSVPTTALHLSKLIIFTLDENPINWTETDTNRILNFLKEKHGDSFSNNQALLN